MKKKFKLHGSIALYISLFILIVSVFTVGSVIVTNGKIKDASAIADDPSWNVSSARPYLYWKPTAYFAGVAQKNFIHVYAFEGEKICVGSNIYHAGYNLDATKLDNPQHNDEGSVDIVMYDLDNNPIPIDVTKNGTGHIRDLASEKSAKNLTSPNGDSNYTPYVYTVSESGIYTFEFRSYSGGNGAGYVGPKNQQWHDPKDYTQEQGLVAAWDITVFDEGNVKQTGRTYADYLAMQLTGDMKERYYILTSDSYVYDMIYRGIQPNTYTFFANNSGLLDSANGSILYSSVKCEDNSHIGNNEAFGATYRYPGSKDTDTMKGAYIFFEKPSEELEGLMYEKAVPPDPAKNVRFVDYVTYQNERGENVTEKGTYEGLGGYFAFDVEEATTATLRLEFKIKGPDGSLVKYEPVEISGSVNPHSTNYFFWDGKDGNGNIIPQGSYSIEDIIYTITTKAGEIHFPLLDIEHGGPGITITRVSNLYDKEGKQIDVPGNIYDKTRSVIYYDETAIYYGENVGITGKAESEVAVYKNGASKMQTDDLGNSFFPYNNFTYKLNGADVGEKKAYDTYGKLHGLRVGDHSHTSNIIDYTDTYENQKDVIDYLDSNLNPLAMASTSSGNSTTYDYGIANYWTFTPSQAVTPDVQEEHIKIIPAQPGIFNFIGRVFYDEQRDGDYDPQIAGDHPISGVTQKLYKKTDDTAPEDGKTYVYLENNKTIEVSDFNVAAGKTIYELVDTATTDSNGTHLFSSLTYNKEEGTEYIYEVIRPQTTYEVTSERTKPTGTEAVGIYKLYKYNSESTGTEIQKFVVGGDGIELADDGNKTITAIDVGYNYELMNYALKIKKDWNIAEKSGITAPASVIFEVSYNIDGTTGVYDERSLSQILTWNNTYQFLEKQIDGKDVTDYYVSAEYYVYQDKIFRHKYHYNAATATYESFVGDDKYFSLSEYYNSHNIDLPADGVYNINSIPDIDGNGKAELNDLKAIKEEEWKTAKSAGTTAGPGEIVSPFNSVLDRNVTTGTTEINIKNSTEPATIEVLKYTGALDDGNVLEGATFRVYVGDVNTVKAAIERYDNALTALNNATGNKEELEREFNEASKVVKEMQVDSGTTRRNGRIAFSGLNPDLTYTVRERFAPEGYRIIEEYYQVDAKNSASSGKKFNAENYCQVEVSNIEAVGQMDIRKRIQGRAWLDIDKFTFDVDFNYSDVDQSSIEIPISEQVLYPDWKNKIQDFVNNFNSKEDITINNDSKYLETDGQQSADTKVEEGFLKKGSLTESATLNKIAFPAAGNYTFTIRENPIDNDPTLTVSPRIFTVTINVARVPNTPEDADSELTLTNSHLEASLSKASYQDVIEHNDETGDTLGQSYIYGGNNILFTNVYTVQNVAQETRYVVEKLFTGRENNKWLDTDKFTVVVDGHDDTTKAAIRNKNIVMDSDLTEDAVVGDEGVSEKRYTITNEQAEHKFMFNELDFNDITFPVERGDDGIPKTQPVVYLIDIKEAIPDGAEGSVYNGITYSTDVYTLKVTLINAIDDIESEEVDGIIDEMIFDLYKNYNDEDEAANTAIGHCTIVQTAGEEGVVTDKKETHDDRPGSHLLSFNNVYKAKSATWVPSISKTINGREWVAGDSFTFRLNLVSGDRTGVSMPADNIATIVPDESSLAEGQTFSSNFRQVTFTKAGEYHFSVTESFNNSNGITTESTPHELIVKVTDDDVGQLHIKFNDDADVSPTINYVNTYKESGNIDLYIKKTLEGRTWTAKDSFKFILTPNEETKSAIESGVIVMPEQLEGPDAEGNYTATISSTDGDASSGVITKNIGTIKVTDGDAEPQKYAFTIKEKTDDLNNFEYSDNNVTLNLTVSRILSHEGDIPTGDLDVVATYAYNSSGEPQEVAPGEDIIIPFTNYAYVEGFFDITKQLTGRDWKDEDEFKAKVVLTSDNAEYVKTVDDANYDEVVFGKTSQTKDLKFKFFKPDTYTFEITEIKPGAEVRDYIKYDTSVYTVTVTVTDDGNGNLVQSQSITKKATPESQNESAESVVFENVYSTGGLTVTKEVIGTDEDKQIDFNFVVTLDDNRINGDYGDAHFTNGVANLVLKHGDSKKIENLPETVGYTVEEVEANKNDFVTTSTGEEGTISSTELKTAAFTNRNNKDTMVKVLHVKKGTDVSDPENVAEENILYPTETINGKYGTHYSTQNRETEINNKSDIKYRVVKDNVDKKEGDMTVETIYVIYEYDTIPANIKVRHLEKQPEGSAEEVVLYDDETQEGLVGQEYHTTDKLDEINAKYNNKYELVEDPINKDGTFEENEQVITYYYQKKETKVIVSYKEVDTEDTLHDDITINGRIDDHYDAQDMIDDINENYGNKYQLHHIEGETSGQMTEDTIHVTYWYEKKDTMVKVLHVIKGTDVSDPENVDIDGKLYHTEVINGKVDEHYTTQPRESEINEIRRIKYKVVDRNVEHHEGEMTVDTIYVIYEYETIPTSIKVRHLEKQADDTADEIELYPDELIPGVIGQEYKTSDRLNEINETYDDKYELVEELLPSNSQGYFEEDQQVITYYYQKKPTAVVARYLEVGTEKVLYPEITINGRVDDHYETEDMINNINYQNDNKYELAYIDTEDKVSGNMTNDIIYVTYYYQKKPTNVKVLHVIKGTDVSDPENVAQENILYPTETIDGRIDDYYLTHNKENEINENSKIKYRLVTDEVNAKEGYMTEDTIYVVYEYETIAAKVHVKHVDYNTQEEILDEEVLEGVVGDNYDTSNKLEEVNEKYDGIYEYIEELEPENKSGVYQEEEQVVTYYYQKRETKVVVRYLEDGTDNVLYEEITINGRIDDYYETEDKIDDINSNRADKYRFIRVEGETQGYMTPDVKVITYYYAKEFDIGNLNTGDINVICALIVAVISTITIVTIIKRKKLLNK